MDLRELNTYKWLDAQELKPRSPDKTTKAEKAFEKKIGNKLLDLIDNLS